MEKLLNLSEKEKVKKTVLFTLKCRREMIKLAALTPDNIRKLCINFKIKNTYSINDFESLDFLEKAEEIIQSRIFYTGVNYQKIFNSIFGCDEKYLTNAMELEKSYGYCCLRYLYIVINYVNDNFPVSTKRMLSDSERKIVEFLLYSGEERDYVVQNNISQDNFYVILKGICENYGAADVNTILNFVLIEKYFKAENRLFLKVIDVLK